LHHVGPPSVYNARAGVPISKERTMDRMAERLWRDESGLVLSAELIIIVTVAVLGLVVGLSQLQFAVVSELQDAAAALASFNQSFGFTGFRGCFKLNGRTSWTAGSTFIDVFDTCLGSGGPSCDIVCGPSIAVPMQSPAPVVAPTPCATCVPEPQPTVPPCDVCPPAANGPLLPAPQPEIPQGPAPQALPQQL
jgi:hypothetical protein